MDFKPNDKMKLFILSYVGNSALAAQAAGYVGTTQQLASIGDALLRQPEVADAIRERSKYLASSTRIIAQTEEVQHFFSEIMRNNDPYHINEIDSNGVTQPQSNIPLPTRLKSAEMLGKSQGMFIDRVEIKQQVSYVEIVHDAYSIPDSELHSIKLQYEQERLKKLEAKELKDKMSIVDVEEEPRDELY